MKISFIFLISRNIFKKVMYRTKLKLTLNIYASRDDSYITEHCCSKTTLKFFYVFILNIITFKRFPKKFPTKQNFSKIPLSTTLKTGFNFPAVGKLPYVWKYSMHDNFHHGRTQDFH